MTKTLTFLLVLLLFLLMPNTASAELVTVKHDGSLVVNVLSIEDGVGSEIEIKKIANSSSDPDRVSIAKKDDSVNMSVTNSSGSHEMDVTSYKDNLVEIEEVIKPKKTVIGVEGDKFFINQGSVRATTIYPISVLAQAKSIALDTNSGELFLAVMPQSAADSILKTRIITKLGDGSPMEITEDTVHGLSYVIHGKKVINVLNVYDWELDVVAKVSATTGEVVEIETPSWLKSINFLFV